MLFRSPIVIKPSPTQLSWKICINSSRIALHPRFHAPAIYLKPVPATIHATIERTTRNVHLHPAFQVSFISDCPPCYLLTVVAPSDHTLNIRRYVSLLPVSFKALLTMPRRLAFLKPAAKKFTITCEHSFNPLISLRHAHLSTAFDASASESLSASTARSRFPRMLNSPATVDHSPVHINSHHRPRTSQGTYLQ